MIVAKLASSGQPELQGFLDPVPGAMPSLFFYEYVDIIIEGVAHLNIFLRNKQKKNQEIYI